ncbi:MAG: hypothetical protein K2I30_05565 [Clostridia bacterium]|nr:hypothetical protein [Clostridia bacterium]
MQHDEAKITSIYNGEPAGTPQQEAAKLAIQRERRANLPKFELAEGERFYIPREKLIETYRAYYEMLDDMNNGTVNAGEEMRSLMESVLYESYKSEITELQKRYSISGRQSDYVHIINEHEMTPDYVVERRGKGLFKRKITTPNTAMLLCMKEAELERETEYAVRRENIARLELFLYGDAEEYIETFEEIYEVLKATTLNSVRKKKAEILKSALKNIQTTYERKDFKTLFKLKDELVETVSTSVRGKKCRNAAYELTERLIECCRREIEDRKARTSDITVLRLISEILKCKRGVPELAAPQLEADMEENAPWAICNMDVQAPECYESTNAEELFVPPEEIEDEDGAELNELYELESEDYDKDEEPEDDGTELDELEQQDSDDDEEED